jgi:rubrerythrin
MSETKKNLMDAFAGESQANRKYLAFAEKAEADGYPRAAKMFKAAAMAETVHAHAHLKAAGGVGTTEENLKAAAEGEIEAAKAEGDKTAERSFHYANEAEKVHAALYKDVLAALEKGADSDFHVCKICGNVAEGEAPEKCSICGAGKKAFEKVQ